MRASKGSFLVLFILSYGFVAGSGFVPFAQQRKLHHYGRRRQRRQSHRQEINLAPHHRPCSLQSILAKSRRINNDHRVVLSVQSEDTIVMDDDDDGSDNDNSEQRQLHNENQQWQHYLSMMRPITILQAVGAFLVGRLVIILSHRNNEIVDRTTSSTLFSLPDIIMASMSIYLAYGAGMAMNDCADVDVDSKHADKRKRSLASNAISVRSGWMFCVGLSVVSIVCAWLADSISILGQSSSSSISSSSSSSAMVGGFSFVGWSIANLLLMAGYALGMQKIFLVKNILCGFFAVSPLLGASLLGIHHGGSMPLCLPGNNNEIIIASNKLCQLAAIGFPLQISREILKDIEDVDVDRGEKRTFPLVIGEVVSKRIAYGLVGIVNGSMLFSPYYWKMFASTPPAYAVSVAVGTPMCFVASRLELGKGQRLLKKSIYVLLLGMISGLLIQSQW